MIIEDKKQPAYLLGYAYDRTMITSGRSGNHKWLAHMQQHAGCLTGFILVISILYRNRSKWLACNQNVLAILMPELKWIETDQND